MNAAKAPIPKTGKRYPPKSETLEATIWLVPTISSMGSMLTGATGLDAVSARAWKATV